MLSRMKLSEFVIVERAGIFIDPLGFLKSSRSLQDTLFEQFTVQSNHPSYHGLLCAVWARLAKQGLAPDHDDYPRRFRELELLWGLLNAIKGQSVINVNKYRQLVNPTMGLRRVPSGHSIYQRLGYGTLGHYSRPSMAWGMLTRSGRRLDVAGEKLAAAFAGRQGMDFSVWLQRWQQGEDFSQEGLDQLADTFNISASPSGAERASWRSMIAAWTLQRPDTRPLWERPVPLAELDRFQQSALQYRSQFAWLMERYPSLAPRIAVIEDFERLSGVAQFVFDMHLASLEFSGTPALPAFAGKDELAKEVVALAARARSLQEADSGGLFAAMAASPPRYAALEEVIVRHHWAHQKAKGVSPYFNDKEILVRDKVPRAEIGQTLEALSASASVERVIDHLQFRSRRDWHFRRCAVYHDWAHGAAA